MKLLILLVVLAIITSVTTCCVSKKQAPRYKTYSETPVGDDYDGEMDEVQKSHEEEAYWYEDEPMEASDMVYVEEGVTVETDYNMIEPSANVSGGSLNTSNNSTRNYNNGTLAFKLDSVFIIGVASRVEARIVKSEDKDVVTAMIEMFHHTTNGDVRKRVISVSNIMDMELYSFDVDAFNIHKMSSGNQIVDSNTIAHWVWSVKPLVIGEHGLIIKAIVKKSGANIERIVFDEKIDVVSKPKKIYTTEIIMDSIFIKDELNIIKYNMVECDGCNDGVYWGNNGVVKIEIDNEKDFIIESGDNTFIDKAYQSYKWKITPNEKGVVNFEIILENDNERIVLHKGKIEVKADAGNVFKNMVTELLDFWEFLLTFLIIPIVVWWRKRKKKEDS